MLAGSIGPVDIQAQTVFRVISEDSQVERQEALAYKSRLRACWALVNSRDQGTRTRRVRLWRLESILARCVVSVANTMECFDAILVEALIGHAIIELGDRLVVITAIVTVNTCGRLGQQWQCQRQVVLIQHPCQWLLVFGGRCVAKKSSFFFPSTRPRSQRRVERPPQSVSIIMIAAL
jgi:hypothetical protein